MTSAARAPGTEAPPQSERRAKHQERLLATLWGEAFRSARRERLPAADAEDVASMALLDFMEAKFTVLQPVAWIRLVARRKAWSLRRSNVNRARLLVEHEPGVSPPAPEAYSSSIELQLDLRASLGSLPQTERQILLARSLEGDAFEDIATAGGWSVSTVKRRLNRARRSLRLRLIGASLRSSFRGTPSLAAPSIAR